MTSSYTYWHWQCADGSTASNMSGLRSRLAADLWSAAKRRRPYDLATEHEQNADRNFASSKHRSHRLSISHTAKMVLSLSAVSRDISAGILAAICRLESEKTRRQESSSKRLHRCLQRTQTHNTVHTKIKKQSNDHKHEPCLWTLALS